MARGRRLLAWFVTAIAATLLLPPATSVYAAPPSPGDIETQIDDAWNKLEPVIEQYNQIHAQLQDTQAKIDALQAQLAPVQMQVDLAMTRVGAISAQLYESGAGSHLEALLNSGSPDTFLDQLTMLDQLAREQQLQVSGAAALRDQYAAQKKPWTSCRPSSPRRMPTWPRSGTPSRPSSTSCRSCAWPRTARTVRHWATCGRYRARCSTSATRARSRPRRRAP